MEREFHQWLQQSIQQSPHQARSDRNQPSKVTELGIGDDAAVLRSFKDHRLVVTTDTLAENSHFKILDRTTDLERIGHKTLAVNLSDIAAMGARPIAAVLSYVLPRDFGLEDAQRLFHGSQALASRLDVEIVGGDTNSWNRELVVGATVIGVCEEGKDPWTMRTARPGDLVVATGSFGGSLFGKHLDFEPRTKLANYLFENYRIQCATDVSDSLSLDLAAIGQQSGVGIELNVCSIPISDAANELAEREGSSSLQHALTDGEDFELVMAIAESEWQSISKDPNVKQEMTVIGTFIEEPGFFLIEGSERRAFEPAGYSH